jgi:hypothetical protein
MSYDHLEGLKSEGIDAIMNLCAEYCDLHSIESHKGFEVYYLPIQDEEAPQLKALEDALSWLDEAIYLGKKVYIHCRHGIGRTGTIISAYLLRRGLGSKLVNQKIKKLRSQPANFNQWWFLRKLSKKEGKLTIREPSLEWKSLVDLSPFFADYEQLLADVDKQLEKQSTKNAFCGLDHMVCCTRLCRGKPDRSCLFDPLFESETQQQRTFGSYRTICRGFRNYPKLEQNLSKQAER